MASLRSLINRADVESLREDLGTPAWLDDPMQSLVFGPKCGYSYDQNYDAQCWPCWCWQDRYTQVIFEIWGGGGGGAGSCCCAWGPPGGSGAYAKKTLYAKDGAYEGTNYTLCVSPPSCCSPAPTCGYRGCASFVLGAGLSNFCAEGGRPGCSWCYWFGCFPINNTCGVVRHPCYTDCACYYGADFGIPGRHGGMTNNCCYGNACHYQAVHAGPGGFGSSGNVYQPIAAHCNLQNYCDSCRFATQMVNITTAITGYSKAVGVGGTTSRNCGGGCCCGQSGGPGLIKISWSEQ